MSRFDVTVLKSGLYVQLPRLLFVLITACYLGTCRSAKPSREAIEVPSTPGFQPPACGKPNDGKTHLPPEWTTFKVPALGESYIDPQFGCRVIRLTDSSREYRLWDGTYANFSVYYSTFTPLNSDDSMLMLGSNDGSWRITDADGKDVVPVTKMPKMNNGHSVWSATDRNVFYFTFKNGLYEGTVKGRTVESLPIHTFAEYGGIVSPDSADLSQDGDHIALVGQNSNNTMDIFVWSLKRQNKTSTYTTKCAVNQWGVAQSAQPGCIHKLQLTANNLLSIQFAEDGDLPEQGVRLWNQGKLIPLQNGTNHYDSGYDLRENPIFVEMGRPGTLPADENPCPSGWGLDVRQMENLSLATCLLDRQPSWHVSYRGSRAQPWVALSFFDDRKAGPEVYNNDPGFQAPTSRNWHVYEDEIILARIDGRSIYRLVHTRSRSVESYWAQPRAAISRDGKYIVFSSDMAYANGCPEQMHANECTDVYMIHVQ